jgi:hypothetical protein
MQELFSCTLNYFCGIVSSMNHKKGRPALPAGSRRGYPFTIRITKGERLAIEQAAKRTGQKPRDWARKCLTDAAR